MKRSGTAVLLVCLSLGKVNLAEGAAKACFTKAEEQAEQIVRDGIRLREGANGCDGPPYDQQTLALWRQIDQRFGAQFAQQTKIREGAFRREFAKDADNRLDLWNGRIVFHFRHYPLSQTYCVSIKTMLDSMLKKGWGVLTKQAATGKDEVSMDYRLCNR